MFPAALIPSNSLPLPFVVCNVVSTSYLATLPAGSRVHSNPVPHPPSFDPPPGSKKTSHSENRVKATWRRAERKWWQSGSRLSMRVFKRRACNQESQTRFLGLTLIFPISTFSEVFTSSEVIPPLAARHFHSAVSRLSLAGLPAPAKQRQQQQGNTEKIASSSASPLTVLSATPTNIVL